jgi:hypothetical protein
VKVPGYGIAVPSGSIDETPVKVPVLAGQAVHEVCPVSELYVPNGHFWQTEIDVPFVPAK